VKSHLSEVDLDLVGDDVPPNCTEADWEANYASVLDIAKRIMADL